MNPKYVQRDDVPKPLIAALLDPYYQEGLDEHFDSLPPEIKESYDYQFSVTTLPRAGRQRVLHKRHIHKVLLNPLDNWWKMLGHIVHEILQRHGKEGAPDALIEKRIGCMMKIKAWGSKAVNVYVHGQLDRFIPPKGELEDWKFCKAESMMYEDKLDYHFQLNALAYLARKNGYDVKSLKDIFLFRNWEKKYVKPDDPNSRYPIEQFQYGPVPLWDHDKIEKMIQARVVAHINAETMKDDELPFCTNAERWQGIPLHKVYKIDPKTNERQKISKFKDYSRIACQDFMAENAKDAKGNPIKYEIVTIPAIPVKCSFCEISKFCNQRNAEIAAELSKQEEEEE